LHSRIRYGGYGEPVGARQDTKVSIITIILESGSGACCRCVVRVRSCVTNLGKSNRDSMDFIESAMEFGEFEEFGVSCRAVTWAQVGFCGGRG
jgi:hypothetical protein